MKIGIPLQTIEKVIFYNKKDKVIKMGDLLIANGTLYEIHFYNGEKYCFKDFKAILDEFYFGKIPLDTKDFNWLQKQIMKLFRIN